MAKVSKKVVFGSLAMLWLAFAGAGFCMLWDYAQQPGSIGKVSKAWPANVSEEILAADQPTLLVFLHPECGCSRAALAELERVAVRAQRPCAIRIYFNDSEALARPAKDGELWASAIRIPGAMLITDSEGQITRAFGAETSGTCLLFDSKKRLLFQGGITGSRGHEGDNPNEDALLAALDGRSTGRVQCNVYGCAIF